MATKKTSSKKIRTSGVKPSFSGMTEFFACESQYVRESIGNIHFTVETTTGALLR